MEEKKRSMEQQESEEPPVLPMDSSSTSPEIKPGVSIKVDEGWQVSAVPEEKQYFALDANLFDAAVTAVKARLDEKDNNIRNAWLLTEIDHWDLEKERLVLLSDNNVISVKYNFISSSVEELKYIPLSHLTDMIVGDFKYPSSYAYNRSAKGMRLCWGKEPVKFLDRWNPLSTKIPYTTFTSHVLIRRNKTTNARLTIDNVFPEVERAVQDYQNTQGSAQAGAEFKIKEEDLVINSMIGLTALVHNGSNLGFFKRRGAANW